MAGKFTQQEKIERMRAIFDRCLEIAEEKGHDYAGEESAMSNFDDFGWRGIVVRISDKYHRLKNFCKQGILKVKDEGIRDTFMDLINYAALAIIAFDRERAERQSPMPGFEPTAHPEVPAL